MDGNVWAYRVMVGRITDVDLTGFKVEAADGGIGKVDKHSDEVGDAYLVVDTGPWIFGKQVLLPAGTVTAIDTEAKEVRVGLTKEQIKNAPRYIPEELLHPDREYRSRIGGYYGMIPGL
ncbi:PRC-barrel domain containing protein [Streptomyces sp. NPDC046866]|uniref:PRC-barrel domain containing protein n=1 Tax=Streptomyces sp. NPDC046866 TaxID=3154921 RepID=UPI003454C568